MKLLISKLAVPILHTWPSATIVFEWIKPFPYLYIFTPYSINKPILALSIHSIKKWSGFPGTIILTSTPDNTDIFKASNIGLSGTKYGVWI